MSWTALGFLALIFGAWVAGVLCAGTRPTKGTWADAEVAEGEAEEEARLKDLQAIDDAYQAYLQACLHGSLRVTHGRDSDEFRTFARYNALRSEYEEVYGEEAAFCPLIHHPAWSHINDIEYERSMGRRNLQAIDDAYQAYLQAGPFDSVPAYARYNALRSEYEEVYGEELSPCQRLGCHGEGWHSVACPETQRMVQRNLKAPAPSTCSEGDNTRAQ